MLTEVCLAISVNPLISSPLIQTHLKLHAMQLQIWNYAGQLSSSDIIAIQIIHYIPVSN